MFQIVSVNIPLHLFVGQNQRAEGGFQTSPFRSFLRVDARASSSHAHARVTYEQ